jgi:beta-barrel assembly-enhancing protease
MLGTLSAPVHAQVRLPALGETAAEDFSAGTERKLGEQIMRDIVRDPDFLDDPVLVEYLLSLWQPLVDVARTRGEIDADVDQQFAWDAFLVRDRTVNAFALPGGWVGVHLGLIAMTASRDELASVLAHELSHVTQRHIARSVVNSQRASLAGIAGAILAVLAASRSNNADMVQAAMIGGQAVAIQGQLNFSRDMEREADRIGFGVLTGAGFAPSGMAAMFEKLDGANRLNDNGAFPYLRSHPLTVERMSEARSRNLFATPGAAPNTTGQLLHSMMQGRSRVLMDPGTQSLRRLQEPLAGPAAVGGKDRIGQLYAGALASAVLRDHTQAQAAVQQALKLVAQMEPREPQAERQLQLLQAQVALARGDATLALQTLDSITLDADSRAPMMLRAQAALDGQRQGLGVAAAELRRSTEALQVWVAGHKRDGSAWTLLSSTAEAIGLRLRSLRANAEARAAEGDLNGAIDRLRAAQQAARSATVGQDFIEASIIDSRLRDLQGQRRQLALEARGNGRGSPRPEGDAPQPQ